MTFRTEHLAEGVTCILGDCREVLPTLGRVDVMVTSPPYAQQRDYERPIDDWTSLVGSLASTNLISDGQLLVNLGLVYRDGELVEYWADFKKQMRAAGWRLFGHYVWDKGFGAPGEWNGRLAPAHEFIFHFNKKSRQLVKWIPTLGYKHVGKGLRRADGSLSGISSPEKIGQSFKIPDSVIRISPQQSRIGPERAHPAVFPVELPDHLLSTFSGRGDIALDPFMGSGTTGVAAVKLGRRFVGIEIHEPYFDIACRRISEALRQPDMFIEKPKPLRQEALEL